jgi:hypothetical protein
LQIADWQLRISGKFGIKKSGVFTLKTILDPTCPSFLCVGGMGQVAQINIKKQTADRSKSNQKAKSKWQKFRS